MIAGEGGTVNTSVNKAYFEGVVVNLAAMLSAGYHFKNWALTGSGTIDNLESVSAKFTVGNTNTEIMHYLKLTKKLKELLHLIPQQVLLLALMEQLMEIKYFKTN